MPGAQPPDRIGSAGAAVRAKSAHPRSQRSCRELHDTASAPSAATVAARSNSINSIGGSRSRKASACAVAPAAAPAAAPALAPALASPLAHCEMPTLSSATAPAPAAMTSTSRDEQMELEASTSTTFAYAATVAATSKTDCASLGLDMSGTPIGKVPSCASTPAAEHAAAAPSAAAAAPAPSAAASSRSNDSSGTTNGKSVTGTRGKSSTHHRASTARSARSSHGKRSTASILRDRGASSGIDVDGDGTLAHPPLATVMQAVDVSDCATPRVYLALSSSPDPRQGASCSLSGKTSTADSPVMRLGRGSRHPAGTPPAANGGTAALETLLNLPLCSTLTANLGLSVAGTSPPMRRAGKPLSHLQPRQVNAGLRPHRRLAHNQSRSGAIRHVSWDPATKKIVRHAAASGQIDLNVTGNTYRAYANSSSAVICRSAPSKPDTDDLTLAMTSRSKGKWGEEQANLTKAFTKAYGYAGGGIVDMKGALQAESDMQNPDEIRAEYIPRVRKTVRALQETLRLKQLASTNPKLASRGQAPKARDDLNNRQEQAVYRLQAVARGLSARREAKAKLSNYRARRAVNALAQRVGSNLRVDERA